MKVNKNKTLIVTEFNDNIKQLIPLVTNTRREDLIIINSFGAVISQPYGCIMRNILLAVYENNVEEIIIIGNRGSKDYLVNKQELLNRMEDGGISPEKIRTIEYSSVIGKSIANWLAGTGDVRKAVQDNIHLVKRHPLIPESVSVSGFIANQDTNEIEEVS